VCARYSRAYLHHLYTIKEMLASRLNTIHNLWYFADFMRRMRLAIAEGTFQAFRDSFYHQQLGNNLRSQIANLRYEI
jgi:queuine tRNA-ribosyltransferase